MSKSSVGKLTHLGAMQPWHVPLILPSEYRDYRNPIEVFSQAHLDGLPRLFRLKKLTNFAPTKWVKNGKIPFTYFTASDSNGRTVSIGFFGDTRDMATLIEHLDTVHIWGVLEFKNDRLFIEQAEIVPASLCGTVEAIYPGKPRVIRPETTKAKVRESLSVVLDQTVIQLRNLLLIKSKAEQEALFSKLGLPSEASLKGVIWHAHYPRTPDEGMFCQHFLRRLATYFAIKIAQSNIHAPIDPKAAIPVTKELAEKVASHLPYSLTDEQQAAVEGSIISLSKPQRSLIAYSADVGAGKTTIFGTVAVTCALCASKVAILAPNTVLCEQIHKELSATWPFVKYAKVWGKNALLEPDASIFIGTTALINRAEEAGIDFDLVIVDEEHRFSRAQKDALQSASTNYIASTATPIPRTLQLATMGAFEVYRITKTHVQKEIRTQIVTQDKAEMVDLYIRKTLEKGYQAFVVLPIAEGEQREKQTAEEAYHEWEAKFPGRVGLIHGKMTDEEKAHVLQRMRDGEIDLLCATTVIEVGITIPNARTMVIYHPETLGLATLHQLRGRLARKGGIGHLLLYLPKHVSEKTFQRLLVLARETDGFKIAEHDLKLRGFGDLAPNAEKQTGGMPSLLPGYEVTVDDVEELAGILGEQVAQRARAAC